MLAAQKNRLEKPAETDYYVNEQRYIVTKLPQYVGIYRKIQQFLRGMTKNLL